MTLFSLEKTLGMLAMPVALIWLLILAVAGFCLRRRQWGAAVLCLALAALYGCAGNIHLAERLAAELERRVPPVEVDRLETFDAVCVLGGGCEPDVAGRPELGPAGDRVFLAVRLWHAGKARLLVASGVRAAGDGRAWDGGQATRELWRAVGIPDSAILVVPEPCWTTRDEVKAYARLRAERGWKRMALLSSASHLPRAMAFAEKAGLECTPLGADRLVHSRPFQLQYLVPQAEALDVLQRTCWEFLGGWLQS